MKHTLWAPTREQAMRIMHSSEDDSWRTPSDILNAARNAMGGRHFDLDPASDREANRFVGATSFLTKDDNALSLDWHSSRLWLNPPFGQFNSKVGDPAPRWTTTRSKAGTFALKLIKERNQGHVLQAVMLLKFCPDPWWDPIWENANAIALCRRRVVFLSSKTGEPMPNPPQSTMALVYFGHFPATFENCVKSIARGIDWR